MKTIQGLLLSLALILTVASCSKSSTDSSSDGSGKSSSGKKLKIAVIPKGTSHVFWKSIHAGAMKAAKEFNVEVIWQGPQKEDDRDQQISVVETFISKQVDAIVLAPLDEKALAGPVKAAKNSQIPTVIIDSGLKSTDHVSFVATNNFNGGVLAAKRLAEVLDGKGKVLMLRYMVGSASTKNREEGFMKEIAKHEGISVVSSNQYAGATRESALQASQNLLNKYPDIEGIFCPNESSTYGMLKALQEAGKAGKVKFVGFDSSDELLKGMRDGQIHGLTVQDPFNMGYLGVKTAVAAVKGESFEKEVDTGAKMVTPENLEAPEIVELLTPDLKKWLGE